MTAAPVVASGLVMASAVTWSIVLVLGPTSMDRGAAILLALDLLALSSVTVAAITASGSRWARRLAMGLAVASSLIALTVPVGPLIWVALIISGAAFIAAALSLGGYVGTVQRGDAPPPQAVVLALGLLAEPGWIALVGREGLTAGLWALGALCAFLAWAYGRALRPTVPFLRFAFLPLSALAVLAAPLQMAVGVVTYSGALTAAAWTPQARLAVQGTPPVQGTAVPIPRGTRVEIRRRDSR